MPKAYAEVTVTKKYGLNWNWENINDSVQKILSAGPITAADLADRVDNKGARVTSSESAQISSNAHNFAVFQQRPKNAKSTYFLFEWGNNIQ
jgi:hypothetical protein